MFRQVQAERLQPRLQADPTFFNGVKSLGRGRQRDGFEFIHYGVNPQTGSLPGQHGAQDVYFIDPSIQGGQRNIVYSQIADQRMGQGLINAGGFFVTGDPSLIQDLPEEATEQQTLPQPIEMVEAERKAAPEAGPVKVRQRRAKGRTILDERIGADIILGG